MKSVGIAFVISSPFLNGKLFMKPLWSSAFSTFIRINNSCYKQRSFPQSNFIVFTENHDNLTRKKKGNSQLVNFYYYLWGTIYHFTLQKYTPMWFVSFLFSSLLSLLNVEYSWKRKPLLLILSWFHWIHYK